MLERSMSRGKWVTDDCVLGQNGLTHFDMFTKWVGFGCDKEREREWSEVVGKV